MPIWCQCYPPGTHQSPCPLANQEVSITSNGTTAAPFVCSNCGRDVNTLINSQCRRCAFSPHEPRGSWICGRCGTSHAPHVDACSCRPEPVRMEPIIYGTSITLDLGGVGNVDLTPFITPQVPDDFWTAPLSVRGQ